MANIEIQDNTNSQEVWVETSPNDPQTGTLQAGGSTVITANEDTGPWTVSFGSPANTLGVVPAGKSSATVNLSESNGTYTVNVTSS